MSKNNGNSMATISQFNIDGIVIDKYRKLMVASKTHKSPALFASFNYARKMLIQCNRMARELSAVLRNVSGFFSRIMLKGKIATLKKTLEKRISDLGDWLSLFSSHFHLKYPLS